MEGKIFVFIIWLNKCFWAQKNSVQDTSMQWSSCYKFCDFNFQTSTNASREQLNVNRSAQTTLAHLNVLAMKDMNLMKMDLHVEVTNLTSALILE